jgi:hypothetical protein
MFFNRPDLDLASAVPGSFALTPHDGMLSDLRKDYEAMSGMVFGPIPTVDAVVATIAELEQRLNDRTILIQGNTESSSHVGND